MRTYIHIYIYIYTYIHIIIIIHKSLSALGGGLLAAEGVREDDGRRRELHPGLNQ